MLLATPFFPRNTSYLVWFYSFLSQLSGFTGLKVGGAPAVGCRHPYRVVLSFFVLVLWRMPPVVASWCGVFGG